MATIKKEIQISGKGLMKNQTCSVLIAPSDSGEIRFFLNNKEPISANVENVVSTSHCVCLGGKKHQIMLVEHFMAACAFSGIDSLDVHVDKSELPILDGSSAEWVKAFQAAGVVKEKATFYTLSEPVSYFNGKTHIVILPDEDFRITYAVNYAHKDFRNRWVSFDKSNSEEIIGSRTFGFLSDLKKYQFFGFAKGVTYENTIGLKDDGGYTTELRCVDEPIKHKILDAIGDLYLTGVNPFNLKAQIIVKEAGHAVHVKIAKQLQEKLIEIRR